jgi:NADH-quinone oxidoreductase subunit H
MTQALIHFLQPHLWPLVYGVVIIAVLPLLAGYVVLMERKVMADMQVRLGPMRVGPHGVLQPIADALKLLLKEDIIPENADTWIFWLAPVISVTAAIGAYAALPFGPVFQIADLNIGLLFIVAVMSLGIFGIVLGGWSSNSHYSLLGALRSAAQVISYETAVGFALISGLLLAGSLSMQKIVQVQAQEHVWFVFLAPVGFFLYLVGGIAETNRAPFDLPEAESELVAGYMTEYSGFRWACYFLSEYAAMIVVGGIAATLFLGGWLRPFPNVRWLDFFDYVPALFFLGVAGYCFWRTPKQPVAVQKAVMAAVGLLILLVAVLLGWAAHLPAGLAVREGILGAFWFLLKVFSYIYAFMWFRFTFPRFRFDQLMRLGWRWLIPVSIVNVMAIGLALIWFPPLARDGSAWPLWRLLQFVAFSGGLTLLIAAWLAQIAQRRTSPATGGA